MSAYRGISYVMNDGQPYNVPAYKFLGDGQILGVPVSIIIATVIVLAAIFILRRTTLGRYAYAIGANRTGALYSGVNVTRNLVIIYTLAGLLVGVAAMIATSRTVSSQPTAGIGLELDIIAAVVIGGASLNGGRGTILGTIIGTLLISFLRNGCTLLGVSTNVQLIVIGIIIIVAVSVDQLAREEGDVRKMFSQKSKSRSRKASMSPVRIKPIAPGTRCLNRRCGSNVVLMPANPLTKLAQIAAELFF